MDGTKIEGDELKEMQRIMASDAALGAFCGMVFNDMSELADPKMWTEEDIRVRIKAALRIRVIAREMGVGR